MSFREFSAHNLTSHNQDRLLLEADKRPGMDSVLSLLYTTKGAVKTEALLFEAEDHKVPLHRNTLENNYYSEEAVDDPSEAVDDPSETVDDPSETVDDPVEDNS